MKRRVFICILLLFSMVLPVAAEPIKWVDFGVPYESMKYALEQDIATFDQEQHLGWIDILALAAANTGGKCGLPSVKKATENWKKGFDPTTLSDSMKKAYNYYHEAYTAALGGLVGSYAIEKNGEKEINIYFYSETNAWEDFLANKKTTSHYFIAPINEDSSCLYII